MESRERHERSASLWREAWKPARRWWVVAGALLVASLVFLVWPAGAGGVLPMAGTAFGVLASCAVTAGLAAGALALLRLGTRRLESLPVPPGAVATEERQRRLQALARTAWRAGAAAIVVVAGLMVLRHFVDTTPLLAAVSVGGLALTFAVQRLLKDLIAGGECLLDDAAAPGEWVTATLGGASAVTGRVRSVGLRQLVVEGFDGTEHRIPHGAIVLLANHSRRPSAVCLEVEVGFADEPGWLVAAIHEEAEQLATDGPARPWVAGPPVPLGVHALGDARLTARVRVPCVPFAGPTLARALRDRLGARLEREGRAIAPPFAVRALPVDEPG
jgi:hypothetical protein